MMNTDTKKVAVLLGPTEERLTIGHQAAVEAGSAQAAATAYQTALGPLVVVLAFVSLCATPVFAASDTRCRSYATNAVLVNQAALSSGCGFPASQRWQGNVANHYNWCLTAPDAWVDSEERNRAALLALCKGDEQALKCDEYARYTMQQIETARANNCATDQTPRWTAPRENHLAWCMYQGGSLTTVEINARATVINNCQ
jgi:hypothetical protein